MVKISDAELEVMKVVWNRKRATSVEIIEDLKDVTWNYNTIRTLIKRLLVKGAIEIVKKEGKTYTYKAVIGEDEYKVDLTRKILKKLYHGSISEFVIQYCENGGLTETEVKQLIAEINKMADHIN